MFPTPKNSLTGISSRPYRPRIPSPAIDRRRWTEYRGPAPPARNFYGAAATRDVAYLFGGSGEKGSLADLWSWNGERWRKLTAGGKRPPSRDGHDMTLSGERILLFGGTGGSGELADTWELSVD